MNIEIKRAELNDPMHAQGIVDVLDSYARDPVGGGEPLSPDVRERLVPELGRVPNALILLAFDAGIPIGIAVCFFGFSTFKARSLLNVHDLAVVPQRRGRGVGRRLLAAAEEEARARDCCKLTLEVQDANSRARHLYASYGFGDFTINGSDVTRFLEKSLDGTVRSETSD